MEFSPEVEAFFSARQRVQERVEALGFDCTGSGGGFGGWDLEFENEHWLVHVDYTSSSIDPQPGQFELPQDGGEYSVRLRPTIEIDDLEDDEANIRYASFNQMNNAIAYIQENSAT